MHHATVDSCKKALLTRRADLMRRRAGIQADEQELLAEPETDWADRAQENVSVAALDTLSENERVELGRIGAALERIQKGVYGTCLSCATEIPAARLHAVPEADRCIACSNHH